MYTVILDGAYLYHPKIEEYKITDAVLSLEVNKSGLFEFTIYPSHPLFGAIRRLKSVIEVYDDGELIFRGRPLNDTYNLYKAQTIQCEGDLAFFNDSILRPYNFSGSIEDYLTMIIDSHNAQVGDDKKFTLGDVTVTDPNDYIVRSTSQHVKTWEEIKSKLIDNLGGYIRVRRVNNINFIDYLHDSFTISGQSIELTKNILDYQQEINVSEIATVLIPLGAKLEDEEGNETEERLTIGSVNGGLDYIEHSSGISKYGKIWAVQVFDDVTTPQYLKDRGTSSLNSLVNLGVSIEIKAIDLNLVDKSESKLRFFDYVRIISKPHEVDEEMLIKKQTININDPSQNVIEVGIQFDTFIDKQLRNDNVIRLIESNYVTNEVVSEIKQLTTIMQSSITQNAENITIEVLERQETDRILSEKVAEIDVDISSIRLEVSQIGGYNIISNPIGRFGTLDWTFESEHIKAYANAPYNKAYENAPYLKAQEDNGSIMVGVETDTQAKYGFRVWKSGKALSKITPAESGSDYSLHTKVKGTGVLRFKLREYTSATETNKSNFIKETLLGTTNPTTDYSTYEKTVTLDNTTQSVVLVVESDVSSRNGQFALFTNTSFNIGQPKPYGESITDVNNRVDDINARVTIAEDTVDLFTSRVNTVEGQVHTNTSQLQVQAGEISSKVSTNGVISAINQTAELIKINANRINLTGYVTVSSLSGQGTTTIDGSNIKTGTISANRINFNGATGTNVDLSGKITATLGSIGGWSINSSSIYKGGKGIHSGSNANDPAIWVGQVYPWNDGAWQSKTPFWVNNQGKLFATGADISGKITATSGTFTGTVSGSSITGGSISIGNGNFVVTSAGALWATGANISGAITATSGTFSGTVNATGGFFTGGGTGQFSGGYHNSGSFSSGSFGGTLNSPSGTLGGTSYSSIASGASFTGVVRAVSGFSTGSSSTMGTLLPATAGTSNLGLSTSRWGRLFSTYSTNVSSDIRLKENFKTIDNEFDNFIYSLPIGTYNLKEDKDKKPQIGINANFVDSLFPKKVTQYLVEQDEFGYYSAQYTNLVPMLVKVVQSQHHRLIDLEYEVKKLKGEA